MPTKSLALLFALTLAACGGELVSDPQGIARSTEDRDDAGDELPAMVCCPPGPGCPCVDLKPQYRDP